MTIGVLFVDDDQNFLEGLRRSLAKYRNEWRIEVAVGVERAFDVLEKRKVDIIVADQDMPGQSGDYLLEAVGVRWPSTVRVTLSGRSKSEIASRLISKAHYILTKPCKSEEIAQYVTRVAERSKELKNDFVRAAVTRYTTPILPNSTKRSLREGRMDTDLITGAGLLQIAVSHLSSDENNSAPTVTDAMMRLAVEQLIQINDDVKIGSYSNTQVQRLWDETIEIAETAKAMGAAAGLTEQPARSLEVAAAFCNIGSIALADQFPDLYQNQIGELDTPERWEAENKYFGATGLMVGAYLLGIWGFSDAVIEEVINQNVTLSTMAGHDVNERVLSAARDREWPKPIEIENIESGDKSPSNEGVSAQ
ncbi:response regulator [Nisaea sp.]|uniref:response regulator n=1 Tax=Nisaea sp. TaxID=2024842 RepID=UPI00329943A7